MMDWDGDMDGWAYAFMAIGSLLFLALIIVVAFVAVRYFGQGSRPAGRADERTPAEQMLAERYARGEVDEEEYRRRLQALRGQG